MSKFVGKFRKDSDYTEEYGYKSDYYNRKQQNRKKDKRKEKYHEDYDTYGLESRYESRTQKFRI